MRVIGSGLGHEFPGTARLFNDLDFTFNQGDLVAVTGPSGSGKSTLLSLLAGWETPVAGDVVWEDIKSIGWVFQNPYGLPRRTALDHVVLPLLVKGVGRRAAEGLALEVLDRFGLAALARRKFGALSGGEAQRLMLARAVAKAPSLLLVDEPTAQLDPIAAATVNTVLGQLATAEAIVVVATHDPDTRDACPIQLDLRSHAHAH